MPASITHTLISNNSLFDDSDRPLLATGDDRLYRTAFAKAIAEGIRQWHSEESLVLGISGPWGVGKTSLTNFVTEILTEQAPQCRIVDFNPWIFGSRTSLVESFIEEVEIALGSASKDKQKETAKAWRRYGDRLQNGVALAKHLRWGFQAAAACVIYLFGVGLRSFSHWAWIFGGLTLVATSAAGWLTKLVKLVGEYLSRNERDQPALHVLKDRLKQNLVKANEKLIIVIDDLDRIYPKQLTQMIQLIASNVDLPNVVYILVGDREVISSGLSSELKIDGQSYLEKIVHVPLVVPSDSTGEAVRVLTQRLDQLFLTGDGYGSFDFPRWREVYQSCVKPYIKHLRAVKRFLNVLAFHKTLLSSSGELEVDAVDFIAIESLSFFEPDFFMKIRANKDFLTAGSTLERPKEEDARRMLAAIIGGSDEAESARRASILRNLFPVIDRYQSFGGGTWHSDNWVGTSRVATTENFDRYFSLSIAPGDVSNAELNAVLRATDVAKVSLIFERWLEQNALEKGLQRLRQRVDSIALDAHKSISINILNFGDRLTSETEGMFQNSSMAISQGIIFNILKTRVNIGDPASFLHDVLEESKGVSLPAHIVAMVTNLTQTPELQVFFDDHTVKERLRTWLVRRVEQCSLEKNFLEAGDLKLVLRLWQDWGDKEKERKRIVELCVDPTSAAKFVRAMLQISHSSNLDRYGRSKRLRIKPTEVDEYGSWDQIRSMLLDKALPADIEEAFGEALEALRKAAKRRDAGLPEAESPFDEVER